MAFLVSAAYTIRENTMAIVTATITNTEGEKLTIEKVEHGQFAGQHVLVAHCEQTLTSVSTLLDTETVAWLLAELAKL